MLTEEKVQKLKEKLEKEKEDIKKELESFAVSDPNLPGDYDTTFPNLQADPAADLLDSATEVETLEQTLPVEHVLETRLQAIEKALDKIKKSTYGRCANCNQDIELQRLEAYPEAEKCMECGKVS